jgi:hypothetical protein
MEIFMTISQGSEKKFEHIIKILDYLAANQLQETDKNFESNENDIKDELLIDQEINELNVEAQISKIVGIFLDIARNFSKSQTTSNPLVSLGKFIIIGFFLFDLALICIFMPKSLGLSFGDIVGLAKEIYSLKNSQDYDGLLEAIFSRNLSAIFLHTNTGLSWHSDEIARTLSMLLPVFFKQMNNPSPNDPNKTLIAFYLNDNFKTLLQEFLKDPNTSNQFAGILKKFYESNKTSNLARNKFSELLGEIKFDQVSNEQLLNLLESIKNDNEEKKDEVINDFIKLIDSENQEPTRKILNEISPEKLDELIELFKTNLDQTQIAVNDARKFFAGAGDLQKILIEHVAPLMVAEIGAIINADPKNLSSDEKDLLDLINTAGITKDNWPVLGTIITDALKNPQLTESLITNFLQGNIKGVLDEVLKATPIINQAITNLSVFVPIIEFITKSESSIAPQILAAFLADEEYAQKLKAGLIPKALAPYVEQLAPILPIAIGNLSSFTPVIEGMIKDQSPILAEALNLTALITDKDFTQKLIAILAPTKLGQYINIAQDFYETATLRTEVIDEIADAIVRSTSNITPTAEEIKKLKTELNALPDTQLLMMINQDPNQQPQKQQAIQEFLDTKTVKNLDISWLNQDTLGNIKLDKTIVIAIKDQLNLAKKTQGTAILAIANLLNDPNISALLISTITKILPKTLSAISTILTTDDASLSLLELKIKKTLNKYGITKDNFPALSNIITEAAKDSEILIKLITDILKGDMGLVFDDISTVIPVVAKVPGTLPALAPIIDAAIGKQSPILAKSLTELFTDPNLNKILEALLQSEMLTQYVDITKALYAAISEENPELARMALKNPISQAVALLGNPNLPVLLNNYAPRLIEVISEILTTSPEKLTDEEQKIQAQLISIGLTAEKCGMLKDLFGQGIITVLLTSLNENKLKGIPLLDLLNDSLGKILEPTTTMQGIGELFTVIEELVKVPEVAKFLQNNQPLLKEIIPLAVEARLVPYKRYVADRFLAEFKAYLKQHHPNATIPQDITDEFIKSQNLDVLLTWSRSQNITISESSMQHFKKEIDKIEQLKKESCETLLKELPNIVSKLPSIVAMMRMIFTQSVSKKGIVGMLSTIGLGPKFIKIGLAFWNLKNVDDSFSKIERKKAKLEELKSKKQPDLAGIEAKQDSLDKLKETLVNKEKKDLVGAVSNLIVKRIFGFGPNITRGREEGIIKDAINNSFDLMTMKDLFTASDGTFTPDKINQEDKLLVEQLAGRFLLQADANGKSSKHSFFSKKLPGGAVQFAKEFDLDPKGKFVESFVDFTREYLKLDKTAKNELSLLASEVEGKLKGKDKWQILAIKSDLISRALPKIGEISQLEPEKRTELVDQLAKNYKKATSKVKKSSDLKPALDNKADDLNKVFATIGQPNDEKLPAPIIS